tara:strand:- start:493 stop:720 length:228 start_codon:yes stop_codon:yes gene_type:complete
LRSTLVPPIHEDGGLVPIESAGPVFCEFGPGEETLTPLAMGFIMDGDGLGKLNAVSLSSFMPFISFIVIAIPQQI